MIVGSQAKTRICADMPVGTLSLRRRAWFAWQSFLFDRNWALQKANHPGSALTADPIFIVGMWRSGTTFLHEILAGHPVLYTPQTWQCFAPSTFLTLGPPSTEASRQRPMDHHKISTFSPQEDEFALLALGAPSAYQGFFRPDQLDRLHSLLSPDFWDREATDWDQEWLSFLRRLPHEPGQKLLLKSPNHIFRLPALARRFPRAKWIYVARPMADCLKSNRKMWRAMFDIYAMTAEPPDALDHFLLKACQGLVDTLNWIEQNPIDLTFVDFSQLTGYPAQTAEKLQKFLGLQPSPGWPTLSAPARKESPPPRTRDNFLSPKLTSISRVLDDRHARICGIRTEPPQ